MVAFTVGGRGFSTTHEEVLARMRGLEPEPIREHLVEMLDSVYPPKQVLAVVTGWERQSFTTMEAQRVLTRLGFTCRRAGELPGGQRAWIAETAPQEPSTIEKRLITIESMMKVTQEAVARLSDRIAELEECDR